jgi:hypothetical protein
MAVMTGRCLAEARWATTPPRKRPSAWTEGLEDARALRIVASISDQLSPALAELVRRGAEQRWLELQDADRRMRGELSRVR